MTHANRLLEQFEQIEQDEDLDADLRERARERRAELEAELADGDET